MEIEDWAGGSSDSEVSSPESDYKDHCYAYGDLPKLQFRFLAKIRALELFDDDDEKCIPSEDIYKKVGGGVGGSSWESFEVYRHLKSLGYIIKRHDACAFKAIKGSWVRSSFMPGFWAIFLKF
ncbi:uncharacterized protein LOC118482743 [Helianthus annuus]|uniref:uncharacterized protein LOC118482743 n=1 Tax=Helianthus annuus TaxID=4232 RepID=UPI0016531A46|nr:uncharacterized protein LOC118482743 [Helianthus annuus]